MNHYVALIYLIRSLGICQQQTEETCNAIRHQIGKSKHERLGKCIMNSKCTGYTCNGKFIVKDTFGQTQYDEPTFTGVSFHPCTMPTSVRVIVGKDEDSKPLMDTYLISDHRFTSTNTNVGYFQAYVTLKEGGLDFAVN